MRHNLRKESVHWPQRDCWAWITGNRADSAMQTACFMMGDLRMYLDSFSEGLRLTFILLMVKTTAIKPGLSIIRLECIIVGIVHNSHRL